MFKAEEALEHRPEGRKIVFKTSFDSLNHTVVDNHFRQWVWDVP